MSRGKLRWSGTKLSSFSDGRACLVVQFLDNEGNMFEWVPAWGQLTEIFDRSANVEVANKPDSRWVGQFAKTAHEVMNKLEPMAEARKVTGILRAVKNGCLRINYTNDENWNDDEEWPPAFRLTRDFLDSWLGDSITALIINGYVIRVSRIVTREVLKRPFDFFGESGTVTKKFLERYPAEQEAPNEALAATEV